MEVITINGVKYKLTPIVEETEVFCDWRLPTIKELLTLVNYNKYDPACDLEDTQSEFYWTSSLNVSGSNDVWYVGFSNGSCGLFYKSNSILVRCVRDGIEGLEWSASSDIEMTWDEAFNYAKGLVAPVCYKGSK